MKNPIAKPVEQTEPIAAPEVASVKQPIVELSIEDLRHVVGGEGPSSFDCSSLNYDCSGLTQ